MPHRDSSNWLSSVSEVAVEAPVFTSLDDIVAYRDHRSRDLSIHNVDLPALAAFHDEVVLRERDGVQLTGEIYVPNGEPPFPTFIYMHGGGWTWGKAEYVRKLGMSFAERGHVVLNLNYGLAPEHPVPWAVEDAVYAARWLTGNAEQYGGDGSVAIGGASAGANLSAAAIVALTADDELVDGSDLADVPVTFSAGVFLYGEFDHALFLAEPGGYAGLAEWFTVSYLGPTYLRYIDDPLVSPLRAAHLDRFPPSYLVCGDEDSVLNQSLAMTRALTSANVPTTLSVPAGLDHSFAYIPYKDPRSARELERIFDWLVEQTHANQPVPA
jgi:acetyl esterase